jgi:hypothetical protein
MARWLKIGVDTPQKPAIRQAAKDCACSVGDAFLAFFRLYAWLDEQTEDGVVATDREEVDAVARLPGFAASLERSGWLMFGPDGEGLKVANWMEHNGQCAKRRAQSTRMMSALREERRKAGMPVRPCPKAPMRPRTTG